jgi:hypothetical protein
LKDIPLPVAFCMWSAKALVMPRPSFWRVKIEGVGDVCECPKKGHCFVDFHIALAVQRSPIGLGEVVAHLNIMSALGRSERNV